MRFLTSYLLACAALALAAGAVLALSGLPPATSGAVTGDASFGDVVARVVIGPLVGGATIFGLLVAQSLPWTPALMWAGATRARQGAVTIAAAPFAAALYWLGAAAAEAGAPVLGVWSMPFGYVWVAMLALIATTISFFLVRARFATQ